MGRSPSCSSKAAGPGPGPGGLVTKGPWTEGEDAILAAYIKAHGEGNWRTIPKLSGLSRCGKSCRLRWINYLRPDVKRGNFSPDEDELIIKLHALLGNRWSLIAGRIYGRTDNEIKNYWNTHLRRKLCSMGTDPSCHNVSLTLRKCSSLELLDEGSEKDGSTSSGQDVTTPGWDTNSPLESSSTISFDRANHSELDNSMSQDEVYASKPSCSRGEDKKCDRTSHGDCILAAPPLWPAFVDHSHRGEETGLFYGPNSPESVLSYPVTSPPENILSQAEVDPFHFAAKHDWACGGGEALQPLDLVQPLVNSDFLEILSLESHLQEPQGTSWASLSFFDTT